jgi:hypothetical protein
MKVVGRLRPIVPSQGRHRIQITGATFELIKDRYGCTKRGEIAR